MRKLVVSALVLLLIGSLVYSGHVGIASMKAAAELDRAKAALVQESRGFHEESQRRIAGDWHGVAKDYLSEYEMGRLDELFAETARGYQQYADPSGYGKHGNGTLAAETSNRVREAIKRQLGETDDYPITDDKVAAKLNSDARIRRLYALWDATHELYACGRKAVGATSMAEVRQIQDDLQEKKHTLVRLLKTVS